MQAPEHAWIDASAAPLFVWTFPGQTTDEELQRCCAARERWSATWRRPCAWLVDCSAVRKVPATQRKLVSDHLQRFEPHDMLYNKGSALVLPNTFIQCMVTAIFWLAPPRYPNRGFTDHDQARQWARERLR